MGQPETVPDLTSNIVAICIIGRPLLLLYRMIPKFRHRHHSHATLPDAQGVPLCSVASLDMHDHISLGHYALNVELHVILHILLVSVEKTILAKTKLA